jgi:hypothetical protein
MFSGLVVFAALFLTLTSLSAEWLIELCIVTDQQGNQVSLFDLELKGEQMTREAQTSIEHLRSKNTAAEALSRGEMTLIDAAAFFRSQYEDPKSWHHPHRPRPRLEDGESWCRFVIHWTETKIRQEHSASRAAAVRQRLEAELQRQLAYHGTVKLPD